MKKLAFTEILIGLLLIIGSLIIGEQAISVLILTVFFPKMIKKVKSGQIDLEAQNKAYNLFFSISIIILLIIYTLVNNNNILLRIWFHLAAGSIILAKGVLDLFFIRKKPA